MHTTQFTVHTTKLTLTMHTTQSTVHSAQCTLLTTQCQQAALPVVSPLAAVWLSAPLPDRESARCEVISASWSVIADQFSELDDQCSVFSDVFAISRGSS